MITLFRKLRWISAAGLLLVCLGVTSIDSVFKYSWGENIGWLNWRDANGGSQGVEYHSNHLAGYIWAENVGFVNVGNGGGPYTNTNDTNYGVNILGGGNLAGYAWGENIGWINFDTAAALGGAGQQARYDAGANRFRGYAWGENVGWINLDDPTQYVGVVASVTITQWRSIRTHSNGVGNLAIMLNATASGNGSSGPTSETRNGGIQRIEVDFSQPVTLIHPNDVSVIGRTTSGGVMGSPVVYTPASVAMLDGDTMAITFAASPSAGFLPDESCYAISIPSTTIAETLSGDTDVNVRALVADSNGSGTITAADMLLIKSKVSPPADVTTFPQCDLNLSGGLTSADMLLAKSRVTTPTKTALCP
jgi:hypothetical protein